MSKLSISEAARQVPVSRKTLYQSYINKGIISISKDERGRPTIDSSELLRVFPRLQGKQDRVTSNYTEGNITKVTALNERIGWLESMLAEKDKLLGVKDELIASQNQRLLLLDFSINKKRWFWPF